MTVLVHRFLYAEVVQRVFSQEFACRHRLGVVVQGVFAKHLPSAPNFGALGRCLAKTRWTSTPIRETAPIRSGCSSPIALPPAGPCAGEGVIQLITAGGLRSATGAACRPCPSLGRGRC